LDENIEEKLFIGSIDRFSIESKKKSFEMEIMADWNRKNIFSYKSITADVVFPFQFCVLK